MYLMQLGINCGSFMKDCTKVRLLSSESVQDVWSINFQVLFLFECVAQILQDSEEDVHEYYTDTKSHSWFFFSPKDLCQSLFWVEVVSLA